VPELDRLARTVARWETPILRWHRTRLTNAATEGTNLIIKNIKRLAFGFWRCERPGVPGQELTRLVTGRSPGLSAHDGPATVRRACACASEPGQCSCDTGEELRSSVISTHRARLTPRPP
jgi:Transposase